MPFCPSRTMPSGGNYSDYFTPNFWAGRGSETVLPYDVEPARAFLGEAEKTPWLNPVAKPHYVWFRPCIAGLKRLGAEVPELHQKFPLSISLGAPAVPKAQN